MSDPSCHPTREELSAYSLGQLPQERALAIDSHISECQPCCETIVGLSSDDTFVGLLKEARHLPTDQTVDHGSAPASSSDEDVPPQLAEHPRYEILSLIGKGGMGDVYKARHRKMERTVALKVINRGLVRKAEAIDRFHREVKAAAQLSHPNIVTAHDADQAGDFHFMVMEYVDGVDLSQTVKVHGALPVAEACDYIRQAALGLQHAHECGMVHRDIKPHNLMVTAEGIIKILDFGLASLAPEAIPASDSAATRSDLTAAGAIMGTPDFISPEQADDARKADIRSDIYSLGATLYYLLSGRVPFDDGSVMHKLKSHAQVEPAPLNSVRDDVPQELMAIASKMMAKDPDERYLTPKQVADALEAFLRTWQPDGANSQEQLMSSGGSISGSGRMQSRVGDAGWDWRLVMARILLAIACIPVALISYEAWNFSAEFSDLESLGNRVKAYMFAGLCLSTLAGIAFVLHRSNSDLRQSNGRDRRFFGMKASQALAVLAVLVAGCLATVSYYSQANRTVYVRGMGKVVQLVPQEGYEGPTIDPGTSEFAVELWVSSDDATLVLRGARVKLVFEGWPVVESAGLFEGEVISIDLGAENAGMFRVLIKEVSNVRWPDKRYLRPGVRVNCWISVAAQSSGATLQFENGTANARSPAGDDQPGTASTSTSKPELKITGKTVNQGEAGLPRVYDWNFKGRDVGDLKLRLLLAQYGKTEVIQEFNYDGLPVDFANKVRLEVKDAGTGANRKRRVNAILFVESPVPSSSTTINEDKVLSIDVEAPLSDRIERADLALIAPGQTELLLALSYWKGDMSHDRSMESMIAATNGGNASFLFLTLDWTPVEENRADDNEVDLGLLQGAWETESLTESGKALATEEGVGGLLLQIKGNTFVIAERKPNGEKSEVDTGRIEIDSTTTPKTIDFIGRAQSTFGIYELKDGVLRVCVAETGGNESPSGKRLPEAKPLQRPMKFESPAGSNIILMEFAANQPVARKDLSAIQGIWQVTYSEDGGRIAPQEMLKEILFVIDEQNLITEIGGRKSVSTYKLDPSTIPKSLDLTENGRTKQGIYDLEGDRLRICIAESGEQRPTAFDSQPNSANEIVLILKRVKPEQASSADTGDHLHVGPMSPKLARSLIPAAASISNEDFQKLQINPAAQSIKSKSLSMVIMALDISNQSAEEASDFRFLVDGFPHPSEIAAAMSPSRSKGYFSIIQPDYIMECKITDSTEEIAQGKVTFNAPKLYIGSVTFEARKHAGTWRIERFHLPSRQISIVLGQDGIWHRAGKEAQGNKAPAPSVSTPDETPESSSSC